MTDTSAGAEPSAEQQGEIEGGLWVVGQNVEIAQIPADADEEPTGEELA